MTTTGGPMTDYWLDGDYACPATIPASHHTRTVEQTAGIECTGDGIMHGDCDRRSWEDPPHTWCPDCPGCDRCGGVA